MFQLLLLFSKKQSTLFIPLRTCVSTSRQPIRATVKMTSSMPSVAAEVTQLFRTRRVSEIRQIESRVRSDAEDKAEALRDLLGTRYKDLLSAADVVIATRDASRDRVTNALGSLARAATELRTEFLARGAYDAPLGDVERRRRVHAVGARLKHIVDSTEAVYAHLDAGRLYDAAARIAAAKRNFDALGADAPRFAGAQWRAVAAFRAQVRAAAEERLVSERIDSTELAGVVGALVVLDGDVGDVLGRFLGARAGAVRKELTASNGKMCERIRQVARLVKATVMATAHMLKRDGGLVLSLVAAADEVAGVRVGRDLGKIADMCKPWLDDVRVLLENDGRRLLSGDRAHTPRELAMALTDVEEILSDEACKSACEEVLGVKADVLFEVFKPVISDRADVVARQSVANVANAATAAIALAWAGVRNGDAGALVWDAVGAQAVGDSEANVGTLLMGASRPVATVADTVGKELGGALEDAQAIGERIPSVLSTFNEAVRIEMPRIARDLQKRSETLKPVGTSYEAREICAEQALFAARVAACLFKSKQIEMAFDKAADEYAQFCAILEQVSTFAFAIWAKNVCFRLSHHLRADLLTNLSKAVVDWPKTASVAAVRFSIAACTASNQAGGLALPTKAQFSLREEMQRLIGIIYEETFESVSTDPMQLLFDLLFFSSLLDTNFSTDNIRNAIDPVDLASVLPNIEKSVTDYTARTCVLFGALTVTHRNYFAPYTTTGSANLVPLAPTVPRFAYLPAPMPSTYALKTAGAAGLRTRAAVEQLRTDSDNGARHPRMEEQETSVVDYASKGLEKGLESVGRFGTRFFGSFARSVG